MKIAFVVSWLNQYGGAERVLEAAHALFPDAPVYTSIYDPNALPSALRRWDIRVSFLNRFPAVHRRHQLYLPFYPLAFQSFDLRRYDLVLSIPSAFAQGVRCRPETQLCYCLTPARFLWQYREYIEHEAVGRVPRAILPALLPGMRAWDRHAAGRVGEFVAISRTVQERISRFYRRPSSIIYPPVEMARFSPAPGREVSDYYLVVSRLVPYKRVHLAIEAFNQLKLPLLVAGDGRDRARLERMAGPTVRFLGRVSDAERRQLMARCRAFVFPGEEDFGIAPLEANASGRPVIAYAGGGALDSVIEGQTGALFPEPTAESLARCVRAFDPRAYRPAELRAHAETFDVRVFQQQLKARLEARVPGLVAALAPTPETA